MRAEDLRREALALTDGERADLAAALLTSLEEPEDDLEALLGCRVDVVSAGGLKARDDHIRREAVPL